MAQVFLSVADVAEMFGCSTDLVYAAIAAGELRAARVGRGRKRGRFIIRAEAANEWFSERETRTAAELRARR